ncbi:MAG: hypothetical protein R3C56_19075 [Pirellulaceae bacterium]
MNSWLVMRQSWLPTQYLATANTTGSVCSVSGRGVRASIPAAEMRVALVRSS